MKEKKIGVFTLAISLILLGALFLLDNFIDMNIYDILSIAWPVIIILLGLELIFSKFIFGKDEAKLSISGKSIFFIIVIVCISFVFAAIHQIPLRLDIDGSFIPIVYKNETIENRDIEVQVKDKDKLEVKNEFGNVKVKKGDQKDIKINMQVKMRHNYDGEEAKRIVSDILDVINNDGDTIQIVNNGERITANGQISNLEVDLDIVIPKDMELDITNKYGEVSVDDLGDGAVISNKHGDVSINNLKGDIDIENSYGKVEITSIQGSASVKNKHGKVLANSVSKDIGVENEYGAVEVNDIGGNADISNKHELIEAKKIRGNLTIESSYCKIDIDEIEKDLKINGKGGNINSQNIDGNVRIDSEHGNIKLIEANKAIDIRSRHGQVVFESEKPISDKLEIENEYDRIDVRLPDNQEGKFNIYSKNGRINNDFGLEADEDNNESRIDGNIGNSNVKINIRAINGNIRIDN